jgi:hypothetical protein
MKKILSALAIAFAFPAFADITDYGPGDILGVRYANVCVTNGPSYFDYSVGDFEAIPLFMANVTTTIVYEGKLVDSPGVLVVLSNQDTGVVKVAVLYPDGVVCELLHGENFEPYTR